ncbi:MAG: hypothetical protein PUE13_00355 [Clostridiales bacterium]|nr:hypothetical protein [Clostridiales bacterium]
MKKAIITAVLVAGILSSTARAETTYLFTEYGAKSYSNDFENATNSSLTTYPYFISGSGTASVTDGMNGGRGIAINTAEMGENDKENILFSFHPQLNTARPEKENYYFEIYIKGFNEIPSNIVPYYIYNSKNGGDKSVGITAYGSEPMENGWIKLWYTVPALADYSINGHVGWRYIKAGGDPSELIFDNFAMRPIPAELKIENRSCTNIRDFDLAELAVSGISFDGKSHRIVNKQLINWSVISGDAEISGGKLVFNTNEPQEIHLLADFYGVKSETVLFADQYVGEYQIGDDSEITASISRGTDAYTAELLNNGSRQTVYFMVAAYSKGRLYKVNAEKTELAENGRNVAVCSIPRVPGASEDDVSIRAYVWAGSVGMKNCQKME